MVQGSLLLLLLLLLLPAMLPQQNFQITTQL